MNFVGQLFELSLMTEGLQTLFYFILAAIIIGRNRAIFK